MTHLDHDNSLLMHRRRLLARTAVALSGLVGATHALGQEPAQPAVPVPMPTPAGPPTAHTDALIKADFAGVARFGGTGVPFSYHRNESPTRPSATGGSTLAIAPPIDFVREAGKPVVSISDPSRGGDTVVLKVEGRSILCKSGEELARLVADGSVDPRTPVVVTFNLILHDGPGVRREVWRACLDHLKAVEAVETPGQPRLRTDPLRLMQTVQIITPRKVTIRCESPGLTDVAFVLTDNTILSNPLSVQMTVPALFLSRVYAPGGGGLAMQARFSFLGFGDSNGGASLRQAVDAVFDQLLSGLGRGGTTVRADARGADVQILTTRSVIQNVKDKMKHSSNVYLRGSSPEDVNALLGLIEADRLDLPALVVDKVETFLKTALDLQTLWQTPGAIDRVRGVANNEKLTEDEAERFIAWFNSNANRSQSGSGVGIGSVSVGGGNGSESSTTTSTKEQRRDFVRRFARDLLATQVDGKFPVYSNIDYKVLTAAKLEMDSEQNYFLSRPDRAASPKELTVRFNTSRETLRYDPVEDALPKMEKDLDAIRRRLQAVDGMPPVPGR